MPWGIIINRKNRLAKGGFFILFKTQFLHQILDILALLDGGADALGANLDLLSVDVLGLDIDFLGSFGCDVRVAA